MRFDIDALEAATKATFNVNVGERDDGSPVGFTVVGPGSEQFASADRAMQIFGVKSAAKRKQQLDVSTDDGAEELVDNTEMMHEIILKHCIVGWYGFTIAGKEGPAEFTWDNVSRVIRARPQWAKRLLIAIEDEGNFAAG